MSKRTIGSIILDTLYILSPCMGLCIGYAVAQSRFSAKQEPQEVSFTASEPTATTVNTTYNEEPNPYECTLMNEPWADAYQQFLWNGSYRAEFEQYFIAVHNDTASAFDIPDAELSCYSNSTIRLYANLIYFNDDLVPELVIFADTGRTKIYTWKNDAVVPVCVLDAQYQQYYYPGRAMTARTYQKTMGGLAVTYIDDYSDWWTNYDVHIWCWNDNSTLTEENQQRIKDYDLALQYDSWYVPNNQWKPFTNHAIQLSKFSADDVILELFDLFPY